MDLGGGLGVSGGAPQIPQQLPSCTTEKGDRVRTDVGIPKKNVEQSGAGL